MKFQPLIDATLTAFSSIESHELSVPESFAHIERQEIDGVLVMQTRCIEIAQHGQLRWVHIYAPKIHVFTLFFFPYSHWQLPVYCMEQVIFSAQPIVAMLDMVLLMPLACTSKVQNFMIAAHSTHAHLHQASDTPAWFNECRSGLDFFIRPHDENDMNALSAVHLDALHLLVDLIRYAAPFPKNEAIAYQNYLHKYKQHHRIHAPGLRLMNRSFGQQWTNAYLNSFFQ